jgi:hypothetical protein
VCAKKHSARLQRVPKVHISVRYLRHHTRNRDATAGRWCGSWQWMPIQGDGRMGGCGVVKPAGMQPQLVGVVCEAAVVALPALADLLARNSVSRHHIAARGSGHSSSRLLLLRTHDADVRVLPRASPLNCFPDVREHALVPVVVMRLAAWYDFGGIHAELIGVRQACAGL